MSDIVFIGQQPARTGAARHPHHDLPTTRKD